MLKTLIAAVLLVAGSLSVASPAEAAGPRGCVTKKEFRRVGDGDTVGYVRAVFGQRGRTASSNVFSDGDEWKTLKFRQCGKSWRMSSVTVSFESTEYERWVPNEYCYDEYDYLSDTYHEVCEDWGWYETGYRNPLVATSKSAFWF